MRQGGLELGDFLATIPVQVLTRHAGKQRCIGQRVVRVVIAYRTNTGEQDVGGVELHRSVRTVADLTAPRRTGRQGGGEAQAIQANVFRVFDEVLRITRHQQWRQCGERAALEGRCSVVDRLRRTGSAEDRRTAVVIHEVGAELGVQRIEHVLEGRAPLAAVAGIAIGATTHQNTLIVDVDAVGGQRPQGNGRNLRALGQYAQVVVAAVGNDVWLGEERAAVVDDGLVPFNLIERFGREVFGQALGHIEHVDRDQAFLDLGTRTAERGHVDRVDRVDATTDEGTFTPAHDLLAQTHGAWLIGNGVVVVDEGVEDLAAGRLGAFLAVVVADVLERTAFVLQFKVVPVFATDENTGIAVFQFKVMDALEDLRESFPALEVQVTVIRSLGQTLAAVVDTDEVLVGTFGRPTGTDRQG
ncbi:hypothetical protein D3C80_987910 [compost metagenome]